MVDAVAVSPVLLRHDPECGVTTVPPWVRELLEVPTETWNPVENLEVSLSAEAEETFRQNGPQTTIALGLAARLGRK